MNVKFFNANDLPNPKGWNYYRKHNYWAIKNPKG